MRAPEERGAGASAGAAASGVEEEPRGGASQLSAPLSRGVEPSANAGTPSMPAAESDSAEEAEQWAPPPFQPLRAVAALFLTAAGFGLYERLIFSFWSSPAMGIHDRIPYPAYAALAGAMVLTMAAAGVALTTRAPHWKFGLASLALLACAAEALGGGRFVSYTLKGTLNPPFVLKLKVGERFPAFALPDQDGVTRRGPHAGADGETLIVIYRGDFCPFARFELQELNRARGKLSRAGIEVVAISADPVERSRILARFLGAGFPLLSDAKETLLAPLGLVQRHRSGEPDNALPAFFILDRGGVVRWVFTSPYYREMPPLAALLEAAARVRDAGGPHAME